MNAILIVKSRIRRRFPRIQSEGCCGRWTGAEGKSQNNFSRRRPAAKYLLEASGERVGTVNGLVVTDLGHFRFGKPVRITASVFQGKPSMISLEESAGLSGAIYNKGIGILRGYLGWRYGCPDLGNWQVSLCFEQSYGLVEGDSAVLSQAYGILSALSKVPLNQGIGVTGSMDQFGRIQPVGGINDKIEGVLSILQDKRATGLSGRHISQA